MEAVNLQELLGAMAQIEGIPSEIQQQVAKVGYDLAFLQRWYERGRPVSEICHYCNQIVEAPVDPTTHEMTCPENPVVVDNLRLQAELANVKAELDARILGTYGLG